MINFWLAGDPPNPASKICDVIYVDLSPYLTKRHNLFVALGVKEIEVRGPL